MLMCVVMLLCFCHACGQRLENFLQPFLRIVLQPFLRFLPASLQRRVRPSSATNAPTEGAIRAEAAITALPMHTIGAEAAQQPANASSSEAGTVSGDLTSAAAEAVDECSICLSAFQEGHTLTTLPCRHCFHSDCIRKWCTTAKPQDDLTCPLCKQSIRLPNQSAVTPPATPSASERSTVANSSPPQEIEMASVSHVDGASLT